MCSPGSGDDWQRSMGFDVSLDLGTPENSPLPLQGANNSNAKRGSLSSFNSDINPDFPITELSPIATHRESGSSLSSLPQLEKKGTTTLEQYGKVPSVPPRSSTSPFGPSTKRRLSRSAFQPISHAAAPGSPSFDPVARSPSKSSFESTYGTPNRRSSVDSCLDETSKSTLMTGKAYKNLPEELKTPDADTARAPQKVHTTDIHKVTARLVYSPQTDVQHTELETEKSRETERELSSAEKLLSQRSSAFIEQLRGAAIRRKQEVTRSRDSLAAKEQEHLRSIAEAKQMASSKRDEQNQPKSTALTGGPPKKISNSTSSAFKPFKARPLPLTSSILGSGGLAGVPKVESKPTTTPFSPLLGPRRKMKPSIKALQKPKLVAKKRSLTGQKTTARSDSQKKMTKVKKRSTTSSSYKPFKARPLPSTSGAQGKGGQSGVPKIPTRAATVPSSPHLSYRRTRLDTKQGVNEARREKVAASESYQIKTRLFAGVEPPQDRDLKMKAQESCPRTVDRQERKSQSSQASVSSVGSGSTGLLGLQLLDDTDCRSSIASAVATDENLAPSTPPRAKSSTQGYIPHSTVRAKKRAEFDSHRKQLEKKRGEGNIKNRKRLLKRLNKELNVLRDAL